MQFIRYIIGIDGIKPDHKRRFIEGFAKKAAPLHKLLQKDVEFIWTDKHEEIFNWLKQQLITPPILQYPRFTDTSYQDIGAVLAQIKDKKKYVIAYASRTLFPAEKNYSTVELECLA
ncbi:26240_t:CDS:2 [Dentiscutata erythropus]|uniref:26240_t:CDS:1 n=1 Tax=Dentiscutata erythropus TaxID=1348616 RepID=A0A9N9GRC0_9GLOM|nr:26240_t:CDS:2 [Dentiscutata erythropus]